MDRLLATFPSFQDAQDRKDELPGIMEVWRDASTCTSKVNIHETDLRGCVESVHETCVERTGPGTDWDHRDCWDREIFAWMLLRQDARDGLIAKVQSRADKSPEFFPKISEDEDYSAAHVVKLISEYELQADQLNDTACGVDLGLMGHDPGRGGMPLTAINRTYSCEVDAQASVLFKYLEWLSAF